MSTHAHSGDQPDNSHNQTVTSESLLSRITQLSQSVSIRAIVIAVLALLMLIPLSMVSGVVNERGHRYQEVLREIANAWGGEQTISGPVLTVPFTERIEETTTIKSAWVNNDGNTQPASQKKTREFQRVAHFLPKDLKINSVLDDEFRTRSIFSSVVYRADIDVAATYDPPDLNSLSDNISEIHWDKAYVSLGISDTRAINAVDQLEWNGKPGALSAGTLVEPLQTGFHAKLPTTLENHTGLHQLRMSLNINGSGGFSFTPHGERTQVSSESTWPHPSFQGNTLPSDRNISADGFSAQWDISHLARNYPQQWVGHQQKPALFEMIAGVRMFEPDSLYTRVTRACKYGVLFIGLTFLTLFIFELSIGQRLHMIQYALIGLSLSLFYLVLLSLSEHIKFNLAYTAATLTCTAMISVYTGSVLRSITRGLFVALLLIGLYALLYSLIKMEDFALLMGTLVLLLVVIVLMVITRKLPGPASTSDTVAD